MSVEIERRFLVGDAPPDLPPGVHIRQGYLAIAEGVTVRIRMADSATLTIKGGGGLSRTEVELELTPTDFDELWPLTEGRRVEKTRYRIPRGEHTIELDVFSAALTGTVIAEVEFASVHDAERFGPPEWFGEEVTDDPRWSNAALATNGRPR